MIDSTENAKFALGGTLTYAARRGNSLVDPRAFLPAGHPPAIDPGPSTRFEPSPGPGLRVIFLILCGPVTPPAGA